MNRRSFVKAGLASATLAQFATPQPKKPGITTSVMLWTLKGTFEEKLQIAAKSGIQSVELVSEHINWTEAEIRSMKKLAGSFGLAMDTIIATPDWKNRPVSMVNPQQRDNFLRGGQGHSGGRFIQKNKDRI